MKFDTIKKDNILAIGDTHNLGTLAYLIRQKVPNNSVIISAGDEGLGFGNYFSKDFVILSKLDEWLVEHDVILLAIRGNHSNPICFHPEHPYNQRLKNIEFVEDYSYKTINDKVFLFVGGAISIDRTERTSNRDYWIDEKFVLSDDILTLPKCDVLITHSSGTECYPYGGLNKIAYWLGRDPPLREELINERGDIQVLATQVQPMIWLYGHFHESHSEFSDGTYKRLLNIDEIMDVGVYLK